LQKTDDDNRMPESKVVPAISEQSDSRKPDQSLPAQQQTQIPETIPATQTPQNEAPQENQPALKKNEVLAAILLQARKAIDNQQWLRAQHHLEHALRISPQHAQTFYLYALVYQGLGVPAQTTQMLKRALFLSKPDSDLHQTIKQELDAENN
jgi:uncharacterized protein HemY